MASDEVVYPLRRVQSIVRKLERLTQERAVSVATHAARFACYRPDERILEGLERSARGPPGGLVFVA